MYKQEAVFRTRSISLFAINMSLTKISQGHRGSSVTQQAALNSPPHCAVCITADRRTATIVTLALETQQQTPDGYGTCWNVATPYFRPFNVATPYFRPFNPLNPELNPICYLLALLGAHHFRHVSRIRLKSLTLRLLMSYIYGAPILDVSRSHTTTHHSR